MQIIDCAQLELYTNYFGGTKLKRNYIWVTRVKGLNTTALHNGHVEGDEVITLTR
jgi:hypothetical protein